jgi:hypothetical protein
VESTAAIGVKVLVPEILRMVFHTSDEGVVLFTVDTKDFHALFLDSLIVRLALARAILYLVRFSAVGCCLK